MATSKKTRTVFLTLSLLSLLLLSSFCYATKPKVEEEDEDLSFLEEEEEITSPSPLSDDEAEYYGGGSGEEYEQGWEENDEDEEVEENGGEHSFPEVDEKDVVVLKESNFSEFVSSNDNKFVMVEFFAPWCGHCQALAPEYAAAATELKGEVVLAKVDATEDANLSQKFEVQGFPTILFFAGGETNPKPYQGARTKDAIVAWAKKKSGPAISNVTAVEVAEQILTANNLLAVAFLDSLVGPENEELVAASRLDDDVSFYQTATEDVAKVFHIDPKAKRPALVLLKKDAEKTTFDGNFSKHEILEFVVANKLPLVINFTRENAPALFESSIKKQVLLFSMSKDYEKVMPLFKDAATSFKGKLLFVHVDLNNEEVGKPVSDYFGVTGDGPSVIGFSGNEDQKKFFLTGEITIEAIKTFAQDFVEEKLKPFYKSEPVPEKNDGDVKIVVGNTFDEIVLDESKDVLLEIYAPWCGHCQTLEPIYNKLGKHLRGIDSLVITKMDGTANEHSRAQPDGFPTILFFPAGKKSFDPIVVDTDRTVVALYKFIKQNAAIPFKLQKPTTETKTSDSTTIPAKEEAAVKDETVTDVKEESSKDVKDEL